MLDRVKVKAHASSLGLSHVAQVLYRLRRSPLTQQCCRPVPWTLPPTRGQLRETSRGDGLLPRFPR